MQILRSIFQSKRTNVGHWPLVTMPPWSAGGFPVVALAPAVPLLNALRRLAAGPDYQNVVRNGRQQCARRMEQKGPSWGPCQPRRCTAPLALLI